MSAQSGAQVNSGDTLTLEVGAVPQGGTLSQILTLRNDAQFISAAGLKINKVVLNYEFASPDETAEDQGLECWIPDANNQPVERCRDAKSFSTVVPAGYESSTRATAQRFLIVYKRFDDKARSASLRLDLSGDAKLAGSYSVAIATKQGQPKINWSPAKLEFDFVPPKTCAKKTFQLANVGDAPLVVTGFNPKVDETFKFTLVSPANVDVDGEGKPLVHTGGQPWTLQKPLEIARAPRRKLRWSSAHRMTSPSPARWRPSATCPKQPSWNCAGTRRFHACCSSQVASTTLEAWSRRLWRSRRQGHQLRPGGPGGRQDRAWRRRPEQRVRARFQPDRSGRPAANGWRSIDDRSEQVGQVHRPLLPADYTPTENDPNTPEDETLPDSALIETVSNAFAAPKLTLEGAGVKQTCPIAKVSIDEGEEVVPQTILHLRGDKSTAPGGGKVKKYKWTVKQPAGSNQPLNPQFVFCQPDL